MIEIEQKIILCKTSRQTGFVFHNGTDQGHSEEGQEYTCKGCHRKVSKVYYTKYDPTNKILRKMFLWRW